MKKILGLSALILAGFLPFACQKTYDVPPLSAPAATPTPFCSQPCDYGITCGTGITWEFAYVWSRNINSVPQYAATIALAVDCNPESTDAVTFTGPGVALPLAYAGVTNVNGSNWAVYQSVTVTGALTVGTTYTLTTITSIGTAQASLFLPISPSMSTGSTGVTVTWNGFDYPCLYLYQSPFNENDFTGCQFEASSPCIDNMACGSPCENGASFVNGTLTITGGTGIFELENGVVQTGP